jgi:hypothetical protein
MRTTFSILVFTLAVVGCNNGGGTMMMVDPTVRCMTQCTRVNTQCMTTRDCVPFCDAHGVVYTACDSEIDVLLDCYEGAASSALCGATSACATQSSAIDACIAAHPTDAGPRDAGAAADASNAADAGNGADTGGTDAH